MPGALTGAPYLVAIAGDALRLAVADPAGTCPSLTPGEVAWSGQVAVGALAGAADLVGGFTAAARRLCDPGRRPRLSNPTAQLAAVDISIDTSGVAAVRAGDCEVWVRPTDGGWRRLLAGPRLTAAAQVAFDAHPGASPSAGLQEHYQAHVDTLDDPSAWLTSPVGFVVPPQLQQAACANVREVIVADDGANLTARRCANLAAWLSGGLQVAPDDHPHPSPHGDVTVLHARRR